MRRIFPGELLSKKFEIIVTLIGVTEETGNTIQVILVRNAYNEGSFINDVTQVGGGGECIFDTTYNGLSKTIILM